ncbi:Wbp11 domain containing protein [Trichuris trichiura]|uniref:Wbp11 domain containing protein n=1 Tax=Trichuris trichiura TaxID=36087 RepID=A0A077Z2X5_TRITR|nr:Wbp11 domain containing protein [Trichuris trichiura]
MGRRTTSTKGGRYMNPADQARKIARRKELKKNKKQRIMVRQAVLKNKDPEELLRNIASLDEMGSCIVQLSFRIAYECLSLKTVTAKFAAETDPSEIPLPTSLPPPENDFRNSRFSRPSPAPPNEHKALPTSLPTAAGVSGILKNKYDLFLRLTTVHQNVALENSLTKKKSLGRR